MGRNLRKVTSGVLGKLGRTFGMGLITIIPAVLTVWILTWAFNTVDNLLQPFIKLVWGSEVRGIGFAVSVVIIMIIGFIASNVVGRRVIHYLEGAVPFMPVIRWIYSGIKQIVQSFTSTASGGVGQMKPVLTEFPRKGMKVIGFITNELTHEEGKKQYSVFIPTSPNPTSGYLQIVGEDEVTPLNISIDTALKMIVSAGRVVPEEFTESLSSNESKA